MYDGDLPIDWGFAEHLALGLFLKMEPISGLLARMRNEVPFRIGMRYLMI